MREEAETTLTGPDDDPTRPETPASEDPILHAASPGSEPASAAISATETLAHVKQTKYLFNEGQKISYVGLCRLAILERRVEKYDEPSPLETGLAVGTKSNKVDPYPPEVELARESFENWGRKFMRKLFHHMAISESGKRGFSSYFRFFFLDLCSYENIPGLSPSPFQIHHPVPLQ